ncbi:unnamed protein product [Thelazia callipaeda]|uniref:Complex I assembly factor TIMMDC1, mitochondrial n=1 Tax=Thelazia callipaeda TaxID=103827 RepID=A0A0N5CV69_THECL|nr:unnamed protein product [Thelazia callipaeda]
MSDNEKTIWSKFISVLRGFSFSQELGIEKKDKVGNEKIVDRFTPNCGWRRLKGIYTDGGVHFETGILLPCMEWSFISAVLITAPRGWQEAAERYNRYSKGRIFLNSHDALRRKWDYAFVSFLRRGGIFGSLAALYVGCIVGSITHVTAWRDHFSLWTVPIITTSLPCVFAYPFGLSKMLQTGTLGLTCGLTVSLIVYCASHFCNQTVNDTYQKFKNDYEVMLMNKRDEDKNISIYQKEHKIWFRNLARFQIEREKHLKKDEISAKSSE